MAEKITVMISSTARDLPEHRKEVMDACLRQTMFPVMMEHLPANDDDAIAASLKLVDEADIYVGIFAYRYGYVPQGHDISITEMEYNRAVERDIPRCIFVMDKDHPITIDQVELGEGAAKLEAFKKRLQTENIVNFYKSPADLRANVINSLSQFRVSDITKFHYVSDIPQPPEAYIAHPYTLLQTHRLIGRQAELNLLTDWVTDVKTFEVSKTSKVSIFNIVAIGGMGKSALTWKWFNDIAPQEMKPLAGRMWWSFYESDASFENFVIRALAYVSKRGIEEVKQVTPLDREAQLLAALDREPFLIVLDGLERILLAYARMDAARLQDSQIENKKNLRKTADPRVGRFLKKLVQVNSSYILVSSRLYPAELETDTGDPIPGSLRCDITGLTDEDAVELWRAFGVTGSRDDLLPIFATFDKHPLLIQALAGEVKRYRHTPGDFEQWRKANPNFNPMKCIRTQEAMGHVLEHALQGLDDKAQKALYTIAAFRMPAHFDTLVALLVGEDKPFSNEDALDIALTELEDRGLLGWDKHANRYDLHPIVRSVVWGGLPDDLRNGVFTSLQVHFDSVPKINEEKIESLEDLTPAIELYNTLIGLERYDEAFIVFRERIENTTLYRLSASRQHAELLEMLFPDGLDRPPCLENPSRKAHVLNTLALSYVLSGRPKQSVSLFQRSIELFDRTYRRTGISTILSNLADALRLSGALYASEMIGCQALIFDRTNLDSFREAIDLVWIGLVMATRGLSGIAQIALSRASHISGSGLLQVAQAQFALWQGEIIRAKSLSDSAWQLAKEYHHQRDFIRAALLQGMSALRLGEFVVADERLHYTLARARAVNHSEREIQALVALAELRRRQGDLKAARELLDDVWEYAERGPYPLFHADACNVLAQIERDAGNTEAAVEAATKAYRLAWCDGEPYAYHWGLVAARQHLRELGAPEPEMPPFDESKYEPMPEVEINPHDEFYVEEE